MMLRKICPIQEFTSLTYRMVNARCLSSGTILHSSAVNGFTTNSAESYEKGRPTYSDLSLQQIASIMNATIRNSLHVNRRCIVELGAGTGKFTTSLVKFLQSEDVTNSSSSSSSQSLHPSYWNARYLATEPSDGFRTTLEKKGLKGVEVTFGTGESIPAKTKSVDMIVAAQAFHWMANSQTLQECHRVLRSGGVLVLIWNTYDYSYDWVRQLDDQILTPSYAFKGNVPRQQNGKWRECFQDKEAIDMFGNLHGWYGPYSHSGTKEMVVNRITSTSVVAEREERYQQEMLRRLNHILDTHPELESSRKTGIYTMPYITEIAWVHAKQI